jgi:hypothetical protein
MSNTIFEKALVLDKTPGKMAPLAHKFYKGKYYHEDRQLLVWCTWQDPPFVKREAQILMSLCPQI